MFKDENWLSHRGHRVLREKEIIIHHSYRHSREGGNLPFPRVTSHELAGLWMGFGLTSVGT